MRDEALLLIESGPGGTPAAFTAPREVILAWREDQVIPALQRAEAARQAGGWIAGHVAYEAGQALEPRLAALKPPLPGVPLVALGVFDGPSEAQPHLDRAAAEAPDARLAPVQPLVDRAAYGAAFRRVKAYIAAGDCYQINLTFPLETRLTGPALGLYGALRRGQPVRHGAFLDLGAGPVVVSRSPELFLSLDATGRIETRPMKGTAPRDADPVRDAELAEELRASAKGQAENLMIVDLLRNDISRIARVGSVKVPKLFAVESYATVHQMVSTVTGQLSEPASLPALIAALFPCGSITGAPKIRAMDIIAEVEPHPRGVYCGAIGWMAPDGAASFSVAIRTLSLFEDGRVRLNVGGGIVQDSEEEAEWQEGFWKARYLRAATRPG